MKILASDIPRMNNLLSANFEKKYFSILDVLVSSVGLRCLFKYGQRRNRQTRQPNIDIVRCHCIYVYIYIYMCVPMIAEI